MCRTILPTSLLPCNSAMYLNAEGALSRTSTFSNPLMQGRGQGWCGVVLAKCYLMLCMYMSIGLVFEPLDNTNCFNMYSYKLSTRAPDRPKQ